MAENFYRPVTVSDFTPPVPVRNMAAEELARIEAGPTPPAGFVESFGHQWKTETLTGNLLNQTPQVRVDPSFSLSALPKEQLEALTQGIPDEKLHRFGEALNADHATAIRGQVLEQLQAEQRVTDAGWTGTAAGILAGVADPVAIGVGVATGGVAAGAASAARLGRAGQRIAAAAGGAAGNLAIDAAIANQSGNERDAAQYAFSAALGAAFGYAFGPFSRNPATADLAAEGLEMAQRAVRQDLKSSTALSSPQAAGAAVNPNALDPLRPTGEFNQLADGDVSYTMFGAARIDNAGVVGRSENPAARLLGQALMTDTVGRAEGAINPQAADQLTVATFRRYTAGYARAFTPALRDWMEEKGYYFYQRSRAARELAEQVYAYRTSLDPIERDAFSPAVKRAAEAESRLYQEWVQEINNPRLRQGGVGRPVSGVSLEADPNYVPVVYHIGKMNQLATKVGWSTVYRLFAQALFEGRLGDDADLAEKIGRGVVNNFRKRAYGLESRLHQALSLVDTDIVRAALREEAGLPEEEITRVIGMIERQPPKPSRLQQRTGFNVGTVLRDVETLDGSGRINVRFSDVLETDSRILFNNYSRTMSGRVALAAMKVVDPGTGKVLIDGLTNDAEIEAAIRSVNASAGDRGLDGRLVQRDEKTLRYAFDRIRGIPHEHSGENWAQGLRILRNLNFARLMGQLGFAQAMEVANPIAFAGMRAMLQHMPAFRRIVNGDGEFVLRNGLQRELEAALGVGTDRLRGVISLIDHEASDPRILGSRSNILDKAEGLSEEAAHLVNDLSGASFVNSALQRTMAAVIAQKFADMARRAIGNAGVDLSRVSKADMARLRYMGLDDPMLKRMFTQVREHGSYADGVLFKGRLLQLNLDNWTDPEARHALEMAIFRQSRKSIQETDIGSATRWSSSPLYQTLFQFRTFSITSWPNILLNGLAHRDVKTFQLFSLSLLTGGLVYAVQQHLQAIGRSDAQEYLEKKVYDPKAFALAAFQRAGFSSVIPMLMDTGLNILTPFDPMFDYRTTGQASDFIFGNPTFSLFDDINKAGDAVFRPLMDGRDMSQQEARALLRPFILGNWMPLQTVYSGLISDLPERSPGTRTAIASLAGNPPPLASVG